MAAHAGVGCLELLRGGSGHSHSISASRLGGLSVRSPVRWSPGRPRAGTPPEQSQVVGWRKAASSARGLQSRAAARDTRILRADRRPNKLRLGLQRCMRRPAGHQVVAELHYPRGPLLAESAGPSTQMRFCEFRATPHEGPLAQGPTGLCSRRGATMLQ